MPTYSIDGPDGKTYSIDGPEGATREQVIAKIKERQAAAKAPAKPKPTAQMKPLNPFATPGVSVPGFQPQPNDKLGQMFNAPAAPIAQQNPLDAIFGNAPMPNAADVIRSPKTAVPSPSGIKKKLLQKNIPGATRPVKTEIGVGDPNAHHMTPDDLMASMSDADISKMIEDTYHHEKLARLNGLVGTNIPDLRHALLTEQQRRIGVPGLASLLTAPQNFRSAFGDLVDPGSSPEQAIQGFLQGPGTITGAPILDELIPAALKGVGKVAGKVGEKIAPKVANLAEKIRPQSAGEAVSKATEGFDLGANKAAAIREKLPEGATVKPRAKGEKPTIRIKAASREIAPIELKIEKTTKNPVTKKPVEISSDTIKPVTKPGETVVPNKLQQASHASTNAAFEDAGLTAPGKGEGLGYKSAETEAKANYNPVRSEALANEITKSKRVPLPVEQADLRNHINNLFDQKAAIDTRIAETKAKGEVPNTHDVTASAALTSHLDSTGKALAQGGSSAGSSLGYRGFISKEAFSKSTLTNDLSSRLGSQPLTEKDVSKIGEYSKRIDELEKRNAELEAKPRTGIGPKKPLTAASGAKNTIFKLEDYEAAKVKAKELMGRAAAGIDPELAGLYVKMAGFHLERGIRTAAEVVGHLKADIPGADEKHLTDAAQQAIAKYGKQLQQGRGFGPDIETRGMAGIQSPEVAKARRELAQAKAEAIHYIDSRTPKDFYTKGENLIRGAVLQSPMVFPHLLGATGEAAASDVAGLLNPLNYLFKKKTEANVIPEAKTPGEVLGAFRKMFSKETMGQMKQIAKQGASDLDIQYGDRGIRPISKEAFHNDPTGTAEAVATNLHAATKYPAFVQSFEGFRRAGMRALKSRGEESTEANQMLVEAAAYTRAKETILMNPNKGADAITNALKGLSHAGPGGQAAALAGRVEMPVITVPMNIAGRRVETTFGLPMAGVKALRNLKTQNPAVWNDVIKLSNRGLFGSAMLLAGWAGYKNLGGLYNPLGDNKDLKKMEVGGVEVPEALQHGPLTSELQMGATMRKLYEKATGKGGDANTNALYGLLYSMAEDVPPVAAGKNIVKAMESPEAAGKEAGRTATEFVPGILPFAAKQLDKSGIKHKPRGFTDQVKMAIPGLRNQVPGKKTPLKLPGHGMPKIRKPRIRL